MTNLERACTNALEALCEKLRVTEERVSDLDLKLTQETTRRIVAENKVSTLELKMMSLEAEVAVYKRLAEDRFQRIQELESSPSTDRRRRGRTT